MKTRIEIEQADNGYSMRVWKDEEKEDETEKEDFGYREPKTLIAETLEGVIKIINDNLKEK